MKKTLFAAVLCTIGSVALADEAPASPHQITGTATVVSDYIFRGLTQTWGHPAVQGSIDYAHSSGLYASVWASTISKKVIAGSNVEIDLALGYKGSINQDWTYGAGLLHIYYPGGNWNKVTHSVIPNQKYDFTEAHAFVGYKWVNVKFSQTLNDLLGFNEKTGFTGSTKGSTYTEINADIPLTDDGLVLGLHAGRQDFKAQYNGPAGIVNPDFTDYRISLSKPIADGWVGAIQVTENSNTAFFNGTPSNYSLSDTRDVGKRRFVVSLMKLF